jgi:RHS repeat-associated protein
MSGPRALTALTRFACGTGLLAASALGARAEMAWIAFREVPPSPFLGSTHWVSADFHGEEGMVYCETFCFYYDDRVDPASFQLTVNGLDRTGSMSVVQTNYSCTYGPHWDDWICGWDYQASGAPHLYFNGQTNTLRATVLSWGISDWVENETTYQYVTLPTVEIIAAKPGTTVEKDACLAFGIVSDVATECGILRLTHALPAVRTFGKVRSPTLIYYHDQAQLWAALQVNVLVPSTDQQPESVQVHVIDRITTAVLASKKVDGGPFMPGGAPQRVGIALGLDPDRPTGVLPYRLTLSYRRSGAWEGTYVTIDGELAFVNRRKHGFGAGWWLAGLERLHFGLTGSRILWVGGDGSTRVYVPTDSTSPRLFQAARVDRIDTLVWSAGTSTYTRYLPHGVRVEFDNSGRHRRTVNRLNHVTRFTYRTDSLMLPDSLIVPGGLAYTFAYNAGALTSISASGTTGPRVTELRRQGFGVRAIIDPVVVPGRADSVAFDFVTDGVVGGRTDRRGTRTAFTLESGASTLATASTPLGGSSVVHAFRTAQALNIGPLQGAVGSDSAYTRYDGPRLPADVQDITKLWVNGLGAPLKIADALGKFTTIAYDSIWPGLASQVIRANNFNTRATYDGRGNLSNTIAHNVDGDGGAESTNYQWDAKWDFVTQVSTSYNGIGGGTLASRYAYDPVTGNRIWEEPEGSEERRINYEYYATGHVGLLRATVLPGNVRDSVEYDALGNLMLTRTPLGWETRLSSDAIGWQTLVRTELVLDGSLEQHDSTFYDALGQVTRTVSYGPPRSIGGGLTSAAQAVVAESFYDPEGNVDSLKRSSRPDTAKVGVITTRWIHDALGRRVVEIAPDGARDSTFYDLAGNVDSVRNRRGFKIRMRYDALNRLWWREVPGVTYGPRAQGLGSISLLDWGPASYPWYSTNPTTGLPTENSTSEFRDLTIRGDTATFAYDDVGNMIRAYNADAHIRRTYYPNGRLKTDTLRVLSYLTRDSTKHVYGIEHYYGVGGFRYKLRLPRPLAPRPPAGIADTMVFIKDSRGGIADVYDPLGNWYRFTRNDRYELRSVQAIGAAEQLLQHDSDGRLTGDTIINLSTSAFKVPDPKLRAATLSYVDAGRLNFFENGLGMQDTVRTWYSGLGQVARMEFRQPVRDIYGTPPAPVFSTERFSLDGLGNRFAQRDSTNLTANTGIKNHWSNAASVYDSAGITLGTGRLRHTWHANRQDRYEYDAAGNLVFQHGQWINPGPIEDHASYYGTDGLLRVSEHRRATWVSGQPASEWKWWMTFEEYRYDALGRRVMVRERRVCQEALWGGQRHPCHMGMVRRTVWDGSEELAEVQRPGGNFDGAALMESDSVATQVEPSTWPTHWDANPRFGVVIYTNALGLDRPISVTRVQYVDKPYGQNYYEFAPYSLAPHWDWRGAAEFGLMMQRSWDVTYGAYHGAPKLCRPSTTICHQPTWRLRSFVFASAATPPNYEWNGTLLEDKENGTGRIFRRNRTVDPATGRFTQEDPIGIAGGLNVYGFSNGDPVNFSDPFGLCSVWSAAANVGMGIALARLTGSGYGLTAAGVDIASGCVGLGTVGKAGQLIRALKIGRAWRAANAVSNAVVPSVGNAKLANLMRDLYKGVGSKNIIGSGSTADAIRYERATGLPVGGTFHTQKGTEYLRALNNWLARNPDASARDLLAAQSVRDDLASALAGR